MPRIYLVVSELDHTRYAAAARRAGLSMSAWLRAAAADRLDRGPGNEPFRAEDDVWRFFADRDVKMGRSTEPDWEEHLAAMRASWSRGTTGT